MKIKKEVEMKKLFVFIGESGSGKTTLINELVKNNPEKYKKVVTCTSRKPRMGEIDGEDYHFLPAEYFYNNPDLVLVKNPDYGDCYGTKKKDLFSNSHHLLLASKPTGIQKLIALGFDNIIVVHIEICETLKLERMHQRGDSEPIIDERLKSDIYSHTEINFGNLQTIRLNAAQSLSNKVAKILKAC